MQNYIQGSSIRIQATFEDDTHAVADPTTITAKVKNPAGATTTYVYLTDAALVRDSQGIYHLDIDVDSGGVWYYRFEGTGNVKAASQDKLNCIAEVP